ncbi:MAG: SURF1 family protein [Gammaproteobacteria bacterium]|nr:SURF1 family protein [Gammaproteobacteria bacterium]
MNRPRRFRLALMPSVIAAILLPLFLYLGYWQLQRAQEKRVLQAQYDARAGGALVQVEPRLQPAAALQFYRVVARGYYEPERQILIDNRVHQGQAGYEIITPLRLQNSDVRLLVNRGWIPLGEDREHLPVIATPPGLQEVTGVATIPAEKVFTLAKPEASSARQLVWQHLDMQRYRQTAGFPLQPVVVLLDPESPAGGFTRAWSRLDSGIAVHQGYAFQWFMLAGALIAIYLFIGLRREDETQPKEH